MKTNVRDFVCVFLYVCVCNGNTSPINSLKAEELKLELKFRSVVISTLGLRWIDNTFSSPLNEVG